MARLRHMRYRLFERLRHQDHLTTFLAAQGTRLTSSATSKTVDTVDVAAAAGVATLTFAANAGNGKIVTIGSTVYTFKTNLTEVKASRVLTSDNTNVANTETVTIGTTVYTFQDTLTAGTAGQVHVKIGADADASLLNLARAINNSGGTPGTDYNTTGTAAHPTASASTSVTAHTITITALTPGVAGNSIAATETSGHLSFPSATLTGGVDPITYEVKIGAAATDSLDNLIAAINASGAGTLYSTGTVAHTTVSAAAGAGDTMVATARTAGQAGNSIVTTTDVASATWDVPQLQGGSDATFGPNLTAASHGISNGEGPYIMTSSGGVVPGGYTAGTLVWVGVVGVNTIALGKSREQAGSGDYMTFTDAGTGTISIKKALTQHGVFELLKANKSETVKAISDIDNLS